MTEWMTRNQFEAQAPRMPQSEVQRIVFQVKADELEQEINYPPNIDNTERYLVTPIKRWFGNLDSLYMVIELHGINASSFEGLFYANVMTPYAQESNHNFAWERFCDLSKLPSSIITQPVTWIDSRNQTPDCTVYRSDPRGFESPVYEASSKREGTLLTEYLRQFYGMVEYSLGEPESNCDWMVYKLCSDRRETHVGRYPARLMALEYAFSLSAIDVKTTFLVRAQQSELDKRVYEIVNGSAALSETSSS